MAKKGNGEGSVYRIERPRKDSPPTVRWVAQVRVDGRRWRRTFADTEAKAKKALRKMVNDTEQGTALVDGSLTVGQLATRWTMNVLPALTLSPRTRDTYRWAATIIADDVGTAKLKNLRPETIEAAFARRSADGMSRASLVKVRSVLAMMLRYAERRGDVNRNVAEVVVLPAQARRAVPGRTFTPEQVRALLDASAGDRLAALWVTMLGTGLRPGEACGLTWADVDGKAGIVHVRRSLKLEAGQLVVDERLKTSRSRRSIDVAPSVITALATHRRRQAEERLSMGARWSNSHDLVFTSSVGTPIGPRNLRRSFDALVQRAGLGEGWTPHHCRHTAASLMSAGGVPIETIADTLGHDGTRMGLLVYRHATKPTSSGALALGSMLG